jgi:hypothetical protein
MKTKALSSPPPPPLPKAAVHPAKAYSNGNRTNIGGGENGPRHPSRRHMDNGDDALESSSPAPIPSFNTQMSEPRQQQDLEWQNQRHHPQQRTGLFSERVLSSPPPRPHSTHARSSYLSTNPQQPYYGTSSSSSNVGYAGPVVEIVFGDGHATPPLAHRRQEDDVQSHSSLSASAATTGSYGNGIGGERAGRAAIQFTSSASFETTGSGPPQWHPTTTTARPPPALRPSRGHQHHLLGKEEIDSTTISIDDDYDGEIEISFPESSGSPGDSSSGRSRHSGDSAGRRRHNHRPPPAHPYPSQRWMLRSTDDADNPVQHYMSSASAAPSVESSNLSSHMSVGVASELSGVHQQQYPSTLYSSSSSSSTTPMEQRVAAPQLRPSLMGSGRGEPPAPLPLRQQQQRRHVDGVEEEKQQMQSLVFKAPPAQASPAQAPPARSHLQQQATSFQYHQHHPDHNQYNEDRYRRQQHPHPDKKPRYQQTYHHEQQSMPIRRSTTDDGEDTMRQGALNAMDPLASESASIVRDASSGSSVSSGASSSSSGPPIPPSLPGYAAFEQSTRQSLSNDNNNIGMGGATNKNTNNGGMMSLANSLVSPSALMVSRRRPRRHRLVRSASSSSLLGVPEQQQTANSSSFDTSSRSSSSSGSYKGSDHSGEKYHNDGIDTGDDDDEAESKGRPQEDPRRRPPPNATPEQANDEEDKSWRGYSSSDEEGEEIPQCVSFESGGESPQQSRNRSNADDDHKNDYENDDRYKHDDQNQYQHQHDKEHNDEGQHRLHNPNEMVDASSSAEGDEDLDTTDPTQPSHNGVRIFFANTG